MFKVSSYISLITRFPFVVLCVFLWAWTQMMSILMEPELNLNFLIDTSLIIYLDVFSRTFSLGILLFLVLTMIHEAYLSYMNKSWIDSFGVLVLLLYVISNFMLDSLTSSALLVRQDYIFLMISLVMCFCVIPFFKLSMRSFWKFNNIIFIKLIKVFVYMSIVAGLISTGLFLFDYFLGVFVSLWVYKTVFLLCYGCFGSLYFLSQVPVNLSQFEADTPLPKFYYLVSRIYLVPLVYISTSLFYAYIGLEFLNGYSIEEYLVPFFLIFLILNIFLMLQLGLFDDKVHSNFSTRLYLKYSYFFNLPIVLYFFYWTTKFWFQQGITEFWYLIWVFILSYIIISIYFIFSSQKDIRVIPLAFLLGAVMLSFSPIKPFYVAVNSQYHHLIEFMQTHNLISETSTFDFSNSSELTDLQKYKLKTYLYFLDTHSSLHLLQPHYGYPISVDSINLTRVFYDFDILDN